MIPRPTPLSELRRNVIAAAGLLIVVMAAAWIWELLT